MPKIQEKINIDNKQAVKVPLNKLRINEQNPRYISEEKFAKLVTSLLVFPEMLELRPIVADKDGVVLGGVINAAASPYPVTDAIKEGLPHIQFIY